MAEADTDQRSASASHSKSARKHHDRESHDHRHSHSRPSLDRRGGTNDRDHDRDRDRPESPLSPPLPHSNDLHLPPVAVKSPPPSRLGTKGMERKGRPLTAEDRRLAMLGFTTRPGTNGKPVPVADVFTREEFCPACGTEHLNPSLLDMYPNCKACCFPLRESYHLQRRFAQCEPTYPLEVLFATYGDPHEPLIAREVTELVQRMVVDSYYLHDRLVIKASFKLDKLFGFDPAPGKEKQLRIRYRMQGIFACVILGIMPINQLPVMIILQKADNRYLRIKRALYGHPKGRSTTGRMCIDVTEIVQGFVDLQGGSYLDISSLTPLTQLFSDPCPGYAKDLRIEYEVSGRSGTIWRDELRGRLKKSLLLEESPTVAPLLFVANATYGVTPVARKDQLASIDKQLRTIETIKHRIRLGMQPRPEDVKLMGREQALIEERDVFNVVPCNFVDVTKKMQVLADRGGVRLVLEKGVFDPNAIFGNPSPGVKKILEVNISCQGHDSERYTDSREMTESGHPRNFITNKSARFLVVVDDDPKTGKGVLAHSLRFETDFSGPIVKIDKSVYGDFSDTARLIDVSNDVQRCVRDGVLHISRSQDLVSLFYHDPCPGLRKQLKVDYTTSGFVGNVRVREKNNLLVAGIRLGYPPAVPRDDH